VKTITIRITGAIALVAAALAASAACTTGDDAPKARTTAQKSALSSPPDAGPTFQITAKEAIDWPAVIDELSKDNIFRIAYTAQVNAKNRGDDGLQSLAPEDQKRLAQFNADMKEVYRLYALAGDKGLSTKDQQRVADLQGRYAKARQELYDVLIARPELSASGKDAFRTAVAQINAARDMKLAVP